MSECRARQDRRQARDLDGQRVRHLGHASNRFGGIAAGGRSQGVVVVVQR